MKYPFAHELLQPITFYSRFDISPDSEISSSWSTISKETHFGGQYDWLSRFCKQKNLNDVHLSLTLEGHVRAILADYVIEDKSNSYSNYRMDPKFAGSDLYTIFRYYSFPLFNTSKTTMQEIANIHDLNKIMELTWFCHQPTRNMKPCGICNPCIGAIEANMGWRIPKQRRLLSFFYKKLFLPRKGQIKSFLIKTGLSRFFLKSERDKKKQWWVRFQ